MKVKKYGLVPARPQIVEDKALQKKSPAKSFMAENALLKKLAPSAKHSVVIEALKWLANQIARPFKIDKADIRGERLLKLIRPFSSMLPTTFGDTLFQYRKFLKTDKACPPNLLKNLDQMEKDANTLNKLNPDHKDYSKHLESFKGKVFEQFKKMPDGGTRIFLLNATMNENFSLDTNFVCILTKKREQKYSLRFVGTAAKMQAFTKISQPVAGKEKIKKEFVIDNLDLEKGVFPLNNFLDALIKKDLDFLEKAEIQKQMVAIQSVDQLVTKADRPGKLFWSVIGGALPKGEKEEKRIKLRSEILSLFEIFQKHRRHLNPSTETYKQIKQLLEGVSSNVLAAKEKNYISVQDLNEVSKELKTIDLALRRANEKAKRVDLAKIASNKIVLSGLSQKVLQLPIEKISPKNALFDLGNRTQGRSPSSKIPALKIQSVDLEPYKKVTTKEALLKAVKELQAAWKLSEKTDSRKEIQTKILQLFHEVPFVTFSKEREALPSLWWDLSIQEADELSNAIYEFSKGISDQPKFLKEVAQYEVESFLKMTVMVNFLRSRITSYHLSSISNELILTEFIDPSTLSSINLNSSLKFLGHNFQQVQVYSKTFSKELKLCTDGLFKKYPMSSYEDDIHDDSLDSCQQDLIRQFKMSGLSGYAHMSFWIPPIKDPFLFALYRQATSWVLGSIESEDQEKNTQSNKSVEEKLGIMSPEAFQTDPEGIFRYFLNDYNEGLKEAEGLQSWEKETKLNMAHELPLPSDAVSEFSHSEKQRLLMLLRTKAPQPEILAFMQEMPHLMHNVNVRNFVSALFFTRSWKALTEEGYGFDFNRQAFFKNLPLHLKSLSEALEIQLQKSLTVQPIANLSLAKSQLETLLFYYEMQEKLRQVYKGYDQTLDAFSDNKEKAKALRDLCLRRSEFFDETSYAARVYLRMLIPGEFKKEDLPEIVFNYSLMRAQMRDVINDPAFNAEMERNWILILPKIKENLSQDEGKNWQGVLDHLIVMKDLPLDQSSWEHKGDLIFKNAKYEINLNTFKISSIGSEASILYLPLEIAGNKKDFLSVFPEFTKAPPRVALEVMGSRKIYFFKDSLGISCQVEESANGILVYKWIDGKWMQKVSAEDSKHFDMDDPKEPKKNLFKILKMVLFGSSLDTKLTVPSIFKDNMYMDPKNPKNGVILDQQGEKVFDFLLKHTGHGSEIEKITDLREGKNKEFLGLNSSAKTHHPALDVLAGIESKENILTWTKKGKLRKIELFRLGLTFELNKGVLVCTHPDFKGYSLKTNASLQERQGLSHAVILEHSDPSRPKKLLIPDPASLIPIEETLSDQAKGIAKVLLLIKKIVEIYRLSQGKPPYRSISRRYLIDPKLPNISFSTLELRPYTQEIIKKEYDWPENLMQLAKLALKEDASTNAWEFLNKISFEKPPNQKLITLIGTFLNSAHLENDGAEAAIKVKLCFKILDSLKHHKKQNKNLKENLENKILAQAKIVLAQGRKIPTALRLNEAEFLRMTKIAKIKDADYYTMHLQPYFAAEGATFELGKAFNDTFEERYKAFKIAKGPKQNLTTRIDSLEASLLQKPLTAQDTSFEIPLLKPEEGLPLLFTSSQVAKLFTEKKRKLPALNLIEKGLPFEKQAIREFQTDIDDFQQAESKRSSYDLKASPKALKNFLAKELSPKKQKYEKELAIFRREIDELISRADKPDEQLHILAGQRATASFDELRIAFNKRNFNQLKSEGRLPSTLDFTHLEKLLTSYFDTLSRKNAAEAAIKLIEDITKNGDRKNSVEWESLSTALHRLLTIKRIYSHVKEPRLLTFEAQQFINFKPLDGGLDQLSLLDALVKNPTAVVQAPTGAGKTSVLSVMRSLLKTNGKNLVIQKVLPALLAQTYEKMKDVLGGLYGTVIYPLQFNLKMPLVAKELRKGVDESNKPILIPTNVSIFKNMYYQMLLTIKSQGCILTDYKSLPLLEEKFWKLGQEFVEKEALGEEIGQIDREHFTYLQKILLLLKNRADENMDEFDQPNRPIHKVQLDLVNGSQPLPSAITDASLEVYELLSQDQNLNLAANIQADLSEGMRVKSIQAAIEKMALRLEPVNAANRKQLADYLGGVNEDYLRILQEKEPALRDKITLFKDEFSVYLPLTLRGKSPSRYTRSEDGSRTLPCYSGEKHDAKFGTVLEQVNYTIQDYMQNGITAYDLNKWINILKGPYDSAVTEEAKIPLKRALEVVFQNVSMDKIYADIKDKNRVQAIVDEVNKDPKKVIHFLKAKLADIKTSGSVISMDPQNIVDMSHVVSGTSATMGAPESLHRGFKVDSKMNGQIRASMAMRIQMRNLNPEELLTYDPQNSEKLLETTSKKVKLTAIIDGDATFKGSSQESAIKLLHANNHLRQVGYHKGERIEQVGKPTEDLAAQGFYFNQAHTRGSDIKLIPDAIALLTLGEHDGMREVSQKEGRLRLPTQRYWLGVSKYNDVKTLKEELSQAVRNDAKIDAKDIFREKRQEIDGILRQNAKTKLLASSSIEEFINQFKEDAIRKLFISLPSASYNTSGSYYESHKHIRKEDQKPEEALTAYKEKMLDFANKFDLTEAVAELKGIQYTKELIAKMPTLVSPISRPEEELEMEHEVEVEQEEEVEVESELEIETEQEQSKVQMGFFPWRVKNELTHSLPKHYSPLISFSDSFMPLSRKGTASTRQRDLFDASMYRVGLLYLSIEKRYWPQPSRITIKGIVIEDLLEDSDKYRAARGFCGEEGSFYDIRTNEFIASRYSHEDETFATLIKNPEVINLIAEIKFFDGRANGYNEEELKYLVSWLTKNDPEKMRDHFLNEILRYRYDEKLVFSGSQLDSIFKDLIKE